MLHFNKVVLHNFGSYSHAEVDLENKGFCLVTGENHHKKDNALSNGSGKSFIWSGICFAITGATIQGLKSNLKNIYAVDEDAYVTLDFYSDKDHYVITRYISPKTDLKISKNDADVSGKGIRESEAKLAELLPDLNQDLIASTIIIGQGMPNKFSAFKPSGRKELLEKLTKSDFMIADIKERIANRLTELTAKIREVDDQALVVKTKTTSAQRELETKQAEVLTAVKPDFDRDIETKNKQLSNYEKDINTAKAEIKKLEQETDTYNKKYTEEVTEKAKVLTSLTESYNGKMDPLKAEKAGLEANIRTVESEIRKLKANPEVCPTCGQKIPDAEHFKKEAAEREKIRDGYKSELEKVLNSIKAADEKNAGYKRQINGEYDNKIAEAQANYSAAKRNLDRSKDDLNDYSHYYDVTNGEIIKLKVQKESWDKEQESKQRRIDELTKEIAKLNEESKRIHDAALELNEHLSRVKQLDTLTKRDFRGFILSDIIKYLDNQAKSYSELVFGHKELNLYLDGNDLDISYNGKMFDNLSGGEKTRVDLIIQFAIRDLLTTYLNASSNILVLDEVTDFLDQTSCDAVMNLINTKLKDVESVFIISHHADELNIPVDSSLKVVKDETGVSTITQN